MTLYHHYKNKPYKYLGVARHSESLEELVIYETRYENNNGKTWVRPKGMFFESVEVAGQTVPRFREMPLTICETNEIAASELNVLAPLVQKTLGLANKANIESELRRHTNHHVLIAFIDNQAVGFKIGFEDGDGVFKSWLSGVAPDYRGIGIATDLMRRQHEWCRKSGYTKVTSAIENRFREMIILSLKLGFQIAGTQRTDSGDLAVVVEKNL